jgi:small subunit ribosomal protein S20
MPHTKSAAKRMRTSELKRLANRAEKSRLATTRKQLLDVIATGDKTKADALFRTYGSHLDRAVKHGTLTSNNASRHKARIAARLGAKT